MDKLINMLIQWFDPITIDIGCRIFVHSKAGGKAKKRVITWCKFNILFDFNGLWYIEIVSGLAELVISKDGRVSQVQALPVIRGILLGINFLHNKKGLAISRKPLFFLLVIPGGIRIQVFRYYYRWLFLPKHDLK